MTSRGSAHPRAKLTELQVLWAVSQYRAGMSTADIARALHVSRPTIALIMAGVNWTHVTGGRVDTPTPRNLTSRERSRIIALRKAGHTYADIAQRTGRSMSSVRGVLVRAATPSPKESPRDRLK